MNTINKIKFFLLSKAYLLKHPLYAITCGVIYFLKDFKIKVHFYSDTEIIDLLQKGKSIVRLGDGDIINIQLGMQNIYHRDDVRLRDMYAEIIKTYTNNSAYILSIPRFVTMDSRELASLGDGKMAWGLRMKAMVFLQFNKECSYMDAHSFYYDDYFTSVVAPTLNNKKIICLTNRRIIEDLSANNAIPWKDIFYIESPESNAMDAYSTILDQLNEELKKYDKKDVIILSGMGPVGKYIIFKYAKLGFQGIDIGRGLEVVYKNESLEDMYPELKITKSKRGR